MLFKDLTEDDKLKIKEIYTNKSISWDKKESMLAEYTGVSSRTARDWASKLGYTNPTEPTSPQYEEAKNKVVGQHHDRFLITWAQNGTPVHEPFLRNLEAYAKEIDAEIIIIAGRYKNPTSVFTDEDHETWHSRTLPYLYAGREKIHKNIVIIGDVKIVSTAVNPMTGMKGFSGTESSIFGHPKAQEETAAVLKGRPHKRMLTTGACTVSNYTDSKAGKKGEFHHTLGFVIVEVKDEDKAFMRQVTATDDGNFCDLYYKVKFKGGKKKADVIPGLDFVTDEWEGESKVKRVKGIDAAIMGDIHFGEHDPVVMDATLNVLFKKLPPKEVILHDVFDGKSINPHEKDDDFAAYKKVKDGKGNVEVEINDMLDGLEAFKNYKTVIVRSNHDDFLDRWLRDKNWKKNTSPINFLPHAKFRVLVFEEKADKGVIPYLINERYPDMITLELDDSYRVHEWELGQHGHIGSSGSRGSMNQFRDLTTKMIVGHSHAPSRKDGVIQVGTSTFMRLGYNKGASKWLQCHAIVHQDGKAQLIVIDEGEFTTFE